MIARAMGYRPGHSTFRDVTGPEAAFISAIADAGIVSGQHGMFFPHRSLSRGEAAKMLAAIL
jgi:hypothetical protein